MKGSAGPSGDSRGESVSFTCLASRGCQQSWVHGPGRLPPKAIKGASRRSQAAVSLVLPLPLSSTYENSYDYFGPA